MIGGKRGGMEIQCQYRCYNIHIIIMFTTNVNMQCVCIYMYAYVYIIQRIFIYRIIMWLNIC